MIITAKQSYEDILIVHFLFNSASFHQHNSLSRATLEQVQSLAYTDWMAVKRREVNREFQDLRASKVCVGLRELPFKCQFRAKFN